MNGRIKSLHSSPVHGFSKDPAPSLRLLAGLGVEGDAHLGKTVQHRSRVAKDPSQPNLRQVHLLHDELLRDLKSEGFSVHAGVLGENILTENVDLLGLPTGTRLELGDEVRLEITGLRNPCKQLHQVDPGLLSRLAYRNESGDVVRLAGIMAIVLASGEIRKGDPIVVRRPEGPHSPLVPV